MIRKWRWLNYALVVIPFSVKKVLLEPKQFARLLAQRFLGSQAIGRMGTYRKLASVVGSGLISNGVKSRLGLLLETGDYDIFLRELQKLPLSQKLWFFREGALAEIKRRELYSRIYESRPVAKGAVSINVLYYLNNSLPYTQSGYTVRTQALIGSIGYRIDSLHAVTRLGYPLVIGKFPDPGKEPKELSILMPRFMPFCEAKRYQMAKKMLVRFCVENRISIIQTTSDFKNAALVSDVAQELGIPWIYEMRGEPHRTWLSKYPAQLAGKAMGSLHYRQSESKEIEAAKKASAVIVLSELTEKKLMNAGIPRQRILEVPNAIDSDMEFDSNGARRIRERLGLQDKKIVGTVSSLVPYEGLDTLIRALPQLDDQIVLVLVGDGEDRGRLISLAKSLGIDHRVYFPGRQPNSVIQSWYSIFDVFVVPRRDTPVTQSVTPIKPLNAMAVGTPLVCSDLPALRSVTGGYARFVQPESPDGLASAISEAIENPEGLMVNERWFATRTWEANGEKLAKLYRKLSNQV